MQTALKMQALTADELVVVSGLSKGSVQHWIKALRNMAPTPIYIEGWGPDRNGRPFVPQYRWGSGEDKARPGQSRTPRERMAALRAAKKAANETRT